jgi:hypothetical protein
MKKIPAVTMALVGLCWLLTATLAPCAVISVLGSLSRVTTLAPGDKAEGTVTIRNLSDAPQTARLYQTDYQTFADGRTVFPEPGTVPRSNAGWITLGTRRLDLKAQETATVHYAIQAPTEASLTGSYWSVIMVEGLADTTTVEARTGKPAMGVQSVLRYGIQIITDVGRTGEANLSLSQEQVTVADGRRHFSVIVENTGQRSLCPQVWLELFDAQGGSAGRFQGEPTRVYPGGSARYGVDLGGVKPGKYVALLVLDNKDEAVFGSQYELELK